MFERSLLNSVIISEESIYISQGIQFLSLNRNIFSGLQYCPYGTFVLILFVEYQEIGFHIVRGDLFPCAAPGIYSHNLHCKILIQLSGSFSLIQVEKKCGAPTAL